MTYDFRFASGAGYQVQWAGNEIRVEFIFQGERAGQLIMRKSPLKQCQPDIDALHQQGFSASGYWTVWAVDIQEDQRGRGFGKGLYEAAFKALATRHGPVLVGPMACTSLGTTTQDAKHVWESLKAQYPHHGSVFYLE